MHRKFSKERVVFSINGAGKLDICIQKKRKKEKLYLNPDLVPSIKIYSRYRPKRKVKIIKLLEEKIYKTLFGLHFGKDFLNMSPKVKFMKEKIET